MLRFLALCLLLAAAHTPAVLAEALDPDAELMRRGTAILTVADLDARLSRLSAEERAELARDHQQMIRLLDRLLLNRQLAQEARELGLDRSPEAQHDMQLAIEELLALRRLSHELSPERSPDFSELAFERYQADPTVFEEPERYRVAHVLISSKERSEEDALELANSVRAQADAPGMSFMELVQTYSEDPGKVENNGIYEVTGSGQFVPEFEAAVRAMTAPGEISEPVRTEYGYHVLRLESHSPARQLSFDEVRVRLMLELRNQRIGEARDALILLKRQEPEEGNEDALRQIPNRYGAGIDLRPSSTEQP